MLVVKAAKIKIVLGLGGMSRFFLRCPALKMRMWTVGIKGC